jgi:hypothetical protein
VSICGCSHNVKSHPNVALTQPRCSTLHVAGGSYKEALQLGEAAERLHRQQHSFLPPGLVIEHIEISGSEIVAVGKSLSETACCPVCARRSAQIHSLGPN